MQYTNKYYESKFFSVRIVIYSSIFLFSLSTEYSGVRINGPVDPVGLNPSIIILEASSTYLLIAKWSKLKFATLALIGGQLGHNSVATTQRYAHLANDPIKQMTEKTANSISQALSNNG